MDFKLLNDILSNEGLAVVIIILLGVLIYKLVPQVINYLKERQLIKDRMDKEREERYSNLVVKVQKDSDARESKLNKTIDNIVATNKELSESNKLLIESFNVRMAVIEENVIDIGSKIDNVLEEK